MVVSCILVNVSINKSTNVIKDSIGTTRNGNTDATPVVRSTITAQLAVRKELVKQQQRYGRKGGIAIEGRDIGTHVFPDAELKILLTASVQEQDLKS